MHYFKYRTYRKLLKKTKQYDLFIATFWFAICDLHMNLFLMNIFTFNAVHNHYRWSLTLNLWTFILYKFKYIIPVQIWKTFMLYIWKVFYFIGLILFIYFYKYCLNYESSLVTVDKIMMCLFNNACRVYCYQCKSML